jgi:hypothetical protein
MKEERKVYRVLVGNDGGNRPLGRLRRRWEKGIRMDLREIGWGVNSGSSWLRIGAGKYRDKPAGFCTIDLGS